MLLRNDMDLTKVPHLSCSFIEIFLIYASILYYEKIILRFIIHALFLVYNYHHHHYLDQQLHEQELLDLGLLGNVYNPQHLILHVLSSSISNLYFFMHN